MSTITSSEHHEHHKQHKINQIVKIDVQKNLSQKIKACQKKHGFLLVKETIIIVYKR